MNTLAFATIQELRTLLDQKKISQEELLDYYLQRFQEHDTTLGAALEVFSKESIQSATDQKTNASQGLLAGIPGLLKDNICQKDRIASCASRMLETYRAPYDATIVKNLKESGAYIIGRANMDEFAMGSSNEYSAFQKTANPWNHERVPGGSSGGPAAAVAAGLIPWALGSDTGGSIREPASFCGLVGIKPTYGLVSRYGLIALASSLDQIGPLTRTVHDNAAVLSTIASHDTHDSTSIAHSTTDYTALLNGKLPENCTIGIVDNMLNAPGIEPAVKQALEDALREFEKLGAKIKRISLPILELGIATYLIINRAEAASNLARFDGVKFGFRSNNSDSLTAMYQNTREDGFGLEVRRRILVGNYVLSAGHADQFYTKALDVREAMIAACQQAFKECTFLFMPTSPTGAFKFNAFDNTLQMDLQDYFTVSANITGLPCISVPCGFTPDKLPVGFQLMGPALSEHLIYQTAYAYEQQTPWHTIHPTGY